jgi:hypothetical protein
MVHTLDPREKRKFTPIRAYIPSAVGAASGIIQLRRGEMAERLKAAVC